MNEQGGSDIERRIRQVVFPVSDLSKAKAFFTAMLGAEPYADAPYYVGYRTGDIEVGLDPHGHRDGTGPVPYVDVDDIERVRDELVAAGGQNVGDIRDVGGGLKVATVRDADGNVIGLRQAP